MRIRLTTDEANNILFHFFKFDYDKTVGEISRSLISHGAFKEAEIDNIEIDHDGILVHLTDERDIPLNLECENATLVALNFKL